jgi:hypothetical protein
VIRDQEDLASPESSASLPCGQWASGSIRGTCHSNEPADEYAGTKATHAIAANGNDRFHEIDGPREISSPIGQRCYRARESEHH